MRAFGGTGGGQLIWQFKSHRNQNWQSAAGPQIDGGFSGGTANAFSPHFDYNTSMAWTVAPPSPAFSNRQITQTWMFDEYSNVSFTCSNGTMTNNFIDASFAFGAFKKRRGGWAATGYVDTTGNTNMRDGRKFTLTLRTGSFPLGLVDILNNQSLFITLLKSPRQCRAPTREGRYWQAVGHATKKPSNSV